MRTRRLVVLSLFAPALFGAYQYYQFDDFIAPIDLTKWDNDPYFVRTSKVPVPDGTWDYEVKSTFSISGQYGSAAAVVQYLRETKSTDATPTYYEGMRLEVTTSGTCLSSCQGTVTVTKKDAAGQTQLALVNVGFLLNNTVRTVVWNPVYNQLTLLVYFNGSLVVSQTMNNISVGTGPAGLYMPGAGQTVSIGVKDRIAPSPVDGATIGTSVYPTQIDAQWQAAADDANGVGVASYQIYRNGLYWTAVTSPSFSDIGASPGTVYTYTIYARDWHMNQSTGTSFTVTTPGTGPNPAVVTPPARVGVNAMGAHWGAAGEQVDMLSGNLNFTLPLFKAMGRGAWGQTFALSYNSQIWRFDSGGTWNLGKDVGYGYGWRLMAGSIVPYWSDSYTLQYYLFTDSTGAEYKLDINTNGTWTSSQANYLSYEGANQFLRFPDGSFWKMGCASAGTETDAGTRYPTIMQDTNGNQVLIKYQTGAGAPWSDSSARITRIEDVRAKLDTSSCASQSDPNCIYRTYTFTYNTDAIPHLTGITNHIGTAETYTFSYLSNQSLSSPFSPPVSYPATTLLQSLANAAQLTHSFEYTGGSGEMSKVTFPFGGSIRWAYRSFTFTGSKTVREVQYRYLKKSTTATETTYTLTRDDANNPNNPVNAYTCVADPSGIGQKCWFFNTTPSSWMMGLNTRFEGRPAAGQTATQRTDMTWAQDAAGNPYIATVLTTLDPAGANLQTKTTQVVDTHGNVLQTSVYDYGNLTTAARTYTNTYQNSANYTSIGIWNRLASTTVTNGSQTVTLVTNTYDGSALTSVTGLREYTPVGTYRGNLTTSVVPGRTTNTAYDVTGAVVSGNDGQGHTLSVTQSTATNYAAPDVITVNGNSSSNQNMTYTSWLATSTVTGPNSTSASTTYDSYARPATSTSAHGAVTTYTYSAAGAIPYTVTATTNNHWIQTKLDGFGRTIQSVTGYSDGSGAHTVATVDTEYDSCACSPLGKVKRVSKPYAPGGTVYWTTYTYDGLGRTVTVVEVDSGSTSTTAYAGNVTTITDPAGKWKKQTVDVFGNLKTVNEPNPAGGADYVTTYTYDMLNHLTGVSMTRSTGSQTRTFVYNATTQRLTSETHPESGTASYTYNNDGTVATKTDARGVVTKYTYDSFQRVTMIQYFIDPAQPTVEDLCRHVDLYYDINLFDSTFTQNGWGRLTSAKWGHACTTADVFNQMYSYTPAGLSTKKRLRFARNVGTVPAPNWLTYDLDTIYGYNTEARMTSVTYPTTYTWNGSAPVAQAGVTYNYTYDAMSRPYTVANSQSGYPYVTSAQYNAAGQPTVTNWNGPTETRQYNTRLQLTRLTTTNALDIDYNYSTTNNNGQVTSTLRHLAVNETVSYTYDSLRRLTAVSASASTLGAAWGTAYTYDGFGNLTDKTPTQGSAPAFHAAVTAATNRLVGYTYDASGNVTNIPGIGTIGYDGAGRVALAGSETYVYGPDNMRVYKRRADATEELHFYGAYGERLGTFPIVPNPVSGNTPKHYIGTGSTSLYFAGRRLSAQDRLGSEGNYYPYGEEYTTTAQNKEKFATYYRDTAGLDYARSRYYSSGMGRFLTPDPYRNRAGLGDPGSWNRYAYVQGDPVNNNDPSGLDIGFGFCPAEYDFQACLSMSLLPGVSPPGPGQPWCSSTQFEPGPGALCYMPIWLMAVPPRSQEQDLPSCTIVLFTRNTPRQFGRATPGRHTYLEVINPGTGTTFTLEGGPKDGKLYGFIGKVDPLTGLVIGGIKGTQPSNSSNRRVWDYTGLDACVKGLSLYNEVTQYNDLVHRPTYYALGNYNSNSFTYTLLSDAGLNTSQPPGVTLGWSQRVPGLVP